jgi:hypothetical protein
LPDIDDQDSTPKVTSIVDLATNKFPEIIASMFDLGSPLIIYPTKITDVKNYTIQVNISDEKNTTTY